MHLTFIFVCSTLLMVTSSFGVIVEETSFLPDDAKRFPGASPTEKTLYALMSLTSTETTSISGDVSSCLIDGFKATGVPAITITGADKDTVAKVEESSKSTHVVRVLPVDNIQLKGTTITVFFHCAVPESVEAPTKKKGKQKVKGINLRLVLTNKGINEKGSVPEFLSTFIKNEKKKKLSIDPLDISVVDGNKIVEQFKKTTKTPAVLIVGDEQGSVRVPKLVEVAVPVYDGKTAYKSLIVTGITKAPQAAKTKSSKKQQKQKKTKKK